MIIVDRQGHGQVRGFCSL